jgi:CRISPR/Cas system-associated exonuclease Cas4 (RecB family)
LKQLSTLVQDIYDLLGSGHKCNQDNLASLGTAITQSVEKVLGEDSTPSLRMSNIGSKCDRKLWYTVNAPESAEPLRPEVRFKFAFGHILEELVLFLAKEAGHSVEGTQDTLTIAGVKGHRDAVVDGVLVDVKSASSYSFKKFENGLTEEDDAFGYLDQLGAYLYASKDDPKVVHKDRAAFIAVDKTLGHITVDVQPNTYKDYSKLVELKKAVVSQKEPPPRAFSDEPDGKSGNRKLGTQCSYCSFKQTCWPGMSTYIYSNGPRFLTKVVREPDVPKAA